MPSGHSAKFAVRWPKKELLLFRNRKRAFDLMDVEKNLKRIYHDTKTTKSSTFLLETIFICLHVACQNRVEI